MSTEINDDVLDIIHKENYFCIYRLTHDISLDSISSLADCENDLNSSDNLHHLYNNNNNNNTNKHNSRNSSTSKTSSSGSDVIYDVNLKNVEATHNGWVKKNGVRVHDQKSPQTVRRNSNQSSKSSESEEKDIILFAHNNHKIPESDEVFVKEDTQPTKKKSEVSWIKIFKIKYTNDCVLVQKYIVYLC